MDITEVKITLRDEEKLKAFVSITLDNAFVVRGLKIISGSKGYFVSMPSRKRKDGSHQDIAHPINNEMRKKIEDIILDEYEKIKSKNLTEAKIKTGNEDEFGADDDAGMDVTAAPAEEQPAEPEPEAEAAPVSEPESEVLSEPVFGSEPEPEPVAESEPQAEAEAPAEEEAAPTEPESGEEKPL